MFAIHTWNTHYMSAIKFAARFEINYVKDSPSQSFSKDNSCSA